jgi:hypothetical protein
MNMQNQKVSFRILKFWTHYAPDGKGGMKSTDMVAYAPIGEANLSVNTDAVSRLAKVQPWEPGSENLAAFLANARWNAIKPAYEAWKSGHETPVNGTPLGAWPGISPDQAEALKMAGLRTVEEVAEMSDGVAMKLPLPGMRELRAMAAAFLKASERTAISTELADKDRQLDEMRQQLEEMRLLMQEALQRDDGEPKRRGRPPKIETEAAAA